MPSNMLYIGITAVIVVLMILIAIDRWNVFGNDDANEDSGTDRINRQERRDQDFSVPLTKKHKQLTLPGKIVVLSIGFLILGTSVYIYLVLRNGAPVEVPYANAMQVAAIVIVSIFSGVAYSNSKTRGEATIIYEDEDGEKERTEKIYFSPDEVERNSDGEPVIKEHFATRFLGLWGRRKLVGHDRELRGKRPMLGDVVTHEVPSHAVKVGENEWQWRTQEQQVSEDVADPDYHYTPPIVIPYQRYVRQQERVDKMEMKLDSIKARYGEAQVEIRRLRRKIENREVDEKDDFIDLLKELQHALQPRRQDVTVQQDRRPERRPQSQRDVEEFEADIEGAAES